MKYFYCDDNNVYTMIKYYDYCIITTATLIIQRFITETRENERGEEGAKVLLRGKLSQRSVNSIFSFPFP